MVIFPMPSFFLNTLDAKLRLNDTDSSIISWNMAPFPFENFFRLLKSPLILPFALYMTASFATQLLEIPLLYLFGNAICNRHYRFINDEPLSLFNDVDETLCQIHAVQDQLSDVVGWKTCFDSIPRIYRFMSGGMTWV